MKFLRYIFACLICISLTACNSSKNKETRQDGGFYVWSAKAYREKERFLSKQIEETITFQFPEIAKHYKELICNLNIIENKINALLKELSYIHNPKAQEIILAKVEKLIALRNPLIDKIIELNSELEMLYVVYKTQKPDLLTPKIQNLLNTTTHLQKESLQIQKDLEGL